MLLQTLGYIYLFKLVFCPDTWAVIELLNHITIFSDFPGSSDGKEFVCSVGDLGLIPWLGRAPGERNHYPYQISCLENLMDGGACVLQFIESQKVRHMGKDPLEAME